MSVRALYVCVLLGHAEPFYEAFLSTAMLFVILTLRLYLIKIEDGDEDQCGKSGVEAAVVEYEAAVHFCGYGAYDSAHKACQYAVTESLFSGERTKTRCKSQAVDICLRG